MVAGVGKGLTSVCIVAAGLVALIGSERAASRQTNADRVVVTYWEKWTGDEMKAMKQVVDSFNASQNRIEIKYLSISGIAEKTLLATSGGNPPDLAGLWSDQVVQFADAKALFPLDDMAHEAGLGEKDYISSYWKEMTYHGHLYAFPTSPGTSALYVNKSLMPPEFDSPEKFPKTLSGFERFIAKVSKRAPDGSLQCAAFLPRDGFGSGSWPYMFGASFVDANGPSVNSADNLKAWSWVHSFALRFGVRETQAFRSGFGNYSSPQNPFLSGKLASMMDGPWFGNYIRLYNPKIDWFAVPLPYPDGRPDLEGYTVLNLNTLMIPKGAKHPKEAFEFIKYVQRQDVMERLCTSQYCNTPLAKVSEGFLRNHPNKFIRLFDRLARSPRAVGPVKLGIWSQISQEVGNAVDVMDLGQATPQAALDHAESRLAEQWANYRKQVLNQ
ncbi:MAG: extracellular solute-binding protein [Fimbriimonas sp.]|nr:extracellular solute-binding protein [Fimbriimonas sp.]